jgi:hypothetical protein
MSAWWLSQLKGTSFRKASSEVGVVEAKIKQLKGVAKGEANFNESMEKHPVEESIATGTKRARFQHLSGPNTKFLRQLLAQKMTCLFFSDKKILALPHLLPG